MVGSQVVGQGSRRHGLHNLIWAFWSRVHASPGAYRAMTRLITRLRFLVPGRIGGWSRTRKVPAVAAKSLHRLAREEGFESE
jgi:L-lactate dehydrogenase complex protein LldF